MSSLGLSRVDPALTNSMLGILLFLSLIVVAAPSRADYTADFEARRATALRLIPRSPDSPCVNLLNHTRRKCLYQNLSVVLSHAFFHSYDDQDSSRLHQVLENSIAELKGSSSAARSMAPDDAEPKKQKAYNFSEIDSLLLGRVYYLESAQQQHHLGANALQDIARVFWDFSRNKCALGAANDVMRNEGTENLDLRRKVACWTASQILSTNQAPCGACKYADGSSPRDQSTAWTRYFKAFIGQKIAAGGLIEYFSPVYSKYSLAAFYNLADFSIDPELRRYARNFLDVWWAEWAEEQVGGLHGGSELRAFPDVVTRSPSGSALGWLYLGLGTYGKELRHPIYMTMKTSAYCPPNLVMRIATDTVKRGSYEVRNTRMGFAKAFGLHKFELDGAPAVLRYSYVSPDFVMGTSMITDWRRERWAPFASQNRWNGLILAGGDGRYVFATPTYDVSNTKNLNAVWGVQHFGTQIVQMIPPPFSEGAAGMAVWVRGDLAAKADRDWVFIDSSAYVAFRPAYGGFREGSGSSGLWELGNSRAPVILQVSDRHDYPGFEAFKTAVLSAKLSVSQSQVTFQGLGKAGLLSLDTRGSSPPKINGISLLMPRGQALSSPFLNTLPGSKEVSISFDKQTIVRSFGR
jgi:hypothetical protein